MKKIISLFALLIILSGCIIVRDFGEYWNKGTIDPDLAGKWESSDGSTMEFVKKKDRYEIDYSKRDETVEGARTLAVGRAKMLMVKDKLYNLSGTLNLYEIKDGKLIFYLPSEKKKEEFIATYGRNPAYRVNRSSLEIRKLTPEIFNDLLKLTQIPDYWESSRVYTKAKLEN